MRCTCCHELAARPLLRPAPELGGGARGGRALLRCRLPRREGSGGAAPCCTRPALLHSVRLPAPVRNRRPPGNQRCRAQPLLSLPLTHRHL